MVATIARPPAPSSFLARPGDVGDNLDPVTLAAARLLVALSGDYPEYAHMAARDNAGSWHKYKAVKRVFTLPLAVAHLSGAAAYASRLWQSDGTTRVTIYDADNAEQWRTLSGAAAELADFGLKPILEHSAAHDHHAGGGHLILIWDAPLERSVAFEALHRAAPQLVEFSERFPRRDRCVRLPGGAYFPLVNGQPGPRRDMVATDPRGAVLWERPGVDAARALLSSQSPATWCDEVIDGAARIAGMMRRYGMTPPPPPATDPRPPAPARQATDERPTAPRSLATSVPRAANGYLFAITAAELAEWFNSRHDVASVARAAGALDPLTDKVWARWRGDNKRPNVKLYPDKNSWCDWSDKATVNGGDCLELAALLSGDERGFKRDQMAAMVKWCEARLRDAAAEGRDVDSRVWAMTTGKGRNTYAQLKREATDRPAAGV